MANFPKMTLTNAGRELLTYTQGGANVLTFTRIALGDGTLTTPQKSLTSLVSERLVCDIGNGKLVGENTYQITAFFTNADINEGFWWRETGIFAEGADGKEILYAYTNAGDAGDYIPVGNDERIEKYIYLHLAIENASNVTVNIAGSTVYIPYSSIGQFGGVAPLDDYILKVPDEYIAPRYEEASELTELTIDENIGIAFGKIKKAIKDLIAHFADNFKHNRASGSGGALGTNATTADGAAIGNKAKAGAGGALGEQAESNSGGAVGFSADAQNGGAMGEEAKCNNGGAIGYKAKTENGCAIGYMAQTVNSDGIEIDAIQLGKGTNSVPKSMNVYDYTLMNADGTIPKERLINGTRIEIKPYTGNGSTTREFTFDDIPKMVVFVSEDARAMTPAICINGNNKVRYAFTVNGIGSNLIYTENNLTWNNKTLTILNGGASTLILNANNGSYRYIAIF